MLLGRMLQNSCLTSGVHQRAERNCAVHGPFYSLWEFDTHDSESWLAQAHNSLALLKDRDGFLEGHIMHSPDEPQRYAIECSWVDVGSYRRAIGSTLAKMHIWPFLGDMIDRPTALESLAVVTRDETLVYETSLDDA